MVDTRIFVTQVEPFVRSWLKEQHRSLFEPRELELTLAQAPRGRHGFDAVSTDGRIVAGINGSSGKTSRGKNPSGKIYKAYQELYFLSLVNAEIRLLVLTDPDFYSIMKRETRGRLPNGVELVLCVLPPELQKEVDKTRALAAREVGG